MEMRKVSWFDCFRPAWLGESLKAYIITKTTLRDLLQNYVRALGQDVCTYWLVVDTPC